MFLHRWRQLVDQIFRIYALSMVYIITVVGRKKMKFYKKLKENQLIKINVKSFDNYYLFIYIALASEPSA